MNSNKSNSAIKLAVIKYYCWIPLVALCLFYLYEAIDFPLHDFSNYYFGGKFLAQGDFAPEIYFPYKFNRAIAALGYENIFASYAPNTPFLAVFFAPFSLLAAGTAKLVFNAISISLLVIGSYRLFSFYRISPKWALLIPVLFLLPIRNNILFGQVYFILFFLLAEGWLAYEKENWKSMACFWGLAILLKVFPVLLLVFLAFRKKGSYIFAIVGFCAVLIGISFFFTGIDGWSFYLNVVLPKASNGEIATAFVDNYQSVFMFFKRAFVYETTENPAPFLHNSRLFIAAVLAFKILLLGLGFFISRRRFDLFYAFSFWMIAMILYSPYGSTYGLVLLLFPFLALAQSETSNMRKVIFCILLTLICNLPLSIFMPMGFPFSFLRLLLLIVLFVLFVIELNQKMNWKIITILIVLPMVCVLIFNKQQEASSAILLEDGPILVYDYNIITNHETQSKSLEANYWNGKEGALLWNQEIEDVRPLELVNNQVFYNNRKITSDKSNKLKPMLINNKTIIYLSDYERGIGFFTLRKIEIK